MAYNKFDAEEKAYADKVSQFLRRESEETNYNKFGNGGLVGSQAATSTKEGEITQRLAQLELKINVLHNSVCKIKDILEPVLFLKPAQLKNNIGEAVCPDRTKVGGRINNISYCVDEIKSVVDEILEGIEI